MLSIEASQPGTHMKLKIHTVGEDECFNCGIREQSIFKELTRDDFRLIDQPIHDLSFEPLATMFEQGSEGSNVYTIRSGLVKLVRFQPDGSQRIIRLLTSGDLLGLESTANPVYDSTAITVTPVHACRIPVSVIRRLESDSPRLHSQLLRKWHETLRQADDFIADLASGNARQRLARLLLRLAQGDSTRNVLLPSREDVGAMLGITTETASRTVAAFRREGKLRSLDRQGRHFQVDATALETLSGGGGAE